MNDIRTSFERFLNTLIADYRKLVVLKFIPSFFYIFVIFGAVFSIGAMLFDSYYIPITEPTSTFSKLHSFLLQFCLVISIIFAGSVSICREFENNVIKNIILTGISTTHYLFTRLFLFVAFFAAIALVVYLVDAILFLVYFQDSFNYSTVLGQYGVTFLYLLNAIFLVTATSTYFRVSVFPILFSLLYLFFIEYFFINILKNFGPAFTKSKLLPMIVNHTPMQLLETISTSVNAGYIATKLLFFLGFMVIYALIIWGTTRNAQLALLNKK